MMRTVDKPTAQLEVSMPGMGRHYVNIWLNPDPPSSSGTIVIAQMTTLEGIPMSVESIEFRISRPGAESSQSIGAVPIESPFNDMPKRGRFQAPVQFSGQGDWQIDVIVGMNGQQVVARLSVVVS